MKYLVSIFCICLLGFVSKVIEAGEVDRNYLHRLVAELAAVDREYVAKNEQGYSVNDVVLALRNLDEQRIGGHTWVLIRLRDEPTIEKYVSRFIESEGRDGSARSVLAASYSPWVIPPLIEGLRHGEVEMLWHLRIHGMIYSGHSGESARIIRWVIIRSNELPEETREWAEALRGSAGVSP